MNRKLYLYILAGIFCAVLSALGILFILLPDKSFSETENRNLQTVPDATLAAVAGGRFESKFESYVNDQFPFRNQFIRIKIAADRLLGQTKSGDVFLGKDNTLLEDFAAPDAQNYDAFKKSLTAFKKSCPSTPVYLMAAPTAVNILADKLPFLAQSGDQNAYLDTLQADAEALDIQFIDLRSALCAQKERLQLYYRTDHHWTSDGAYVAFSEYAKAAGLNTAGAAYERLLVSDSFTGSLSATSGYTLPVRDEIYVYKRTDRQTHMSVYYAEEQSAASSCYKTDALNTRDQYALFLGGNHPLIKIRTNAKEDRTLLILKDSYANSLIPFLTDYYRKIIVVDPRYYYDNLGTLMQAEQIDEVLLLFNATTLAQDTTLPTVLNSALS